MGMSSRRREMHAFQNDFNAGYIFDQIELKLKTCPFAGVWCEESWELRSSFPLKVNKGFLLPGIAGSSMSEDCINSVLNPVRLVYKCRWKLFPRISIESVGPTAPGCSTD